MKTFNKKIAAIMEFLNLLSFHFPIGVAGIAMFCFLIVILPSYSYSKFSTDKILSLKEEVKTNIESNRKLTQEIVNSIFSFDVQDVSANETMDCVLEILKKNGFILKKNISGIPTQWIATYGAGKPEIILSDNISFNQTFSQTHGTTIFDAFFNESSSHFGSKNASLGANILAALAIKKIIDKEKLQGTVSVIYGLARETETLQSTLLRAGYFDQTDLCILSHVGSDLYVGYGQSEGQGLISFEISFEGDQNQSNVSVRKTSARNAANLLRTSWEMLKMHRYPLKPAHYFISKDGINSNLQSSRATIWYCFREKEFSMVKKMFDQVINLAEGASTITNSQFSFKILGSSLPEHNNIILAETIYENIREIGLPRWSDTDHELAKAIQKEFGSEVKGLNTHPLQLGHPLKNSKNGFTNGSGDLTWTVPSVALCLPSNVPGIPLHQWFNSAPIAYKGTSAGAKVIATSLVDFMTRPELVDAAKTYFNEAQTKNIKWVPFSKNFGQVSMHEKPLNNLPQERKYVKDPASLGTYFEKMGINYPTVKMNSSDNNLKS